MDEPRNAELERVILDEPDDEAGYLVYGDWLATLDHPRGKLVALTAHPTRAEMTAEIATHLAAHAELWGELRGLDDLVTEVVWRSGFIASARIGHTRGRYFARPKPAPEVAIADVVARLLAGPGRFLRELTVGIVEFEGNDYTSIIARLAAQAPRSLRSLYLGDFRPDDTELNWSTIGDLSPLYAAVPRLERLRLRSGRLTLGALELPALRELAIVTGGLEVASAHAIATATWPRLAKLDVMFGDRAPDHVRGVDPIAPLLAATGVPALRVLGLRNTHFHDELAPALLRSAILPQLRVLDLSLGTLGDREAEVFAAAPDRFAGLDELIVGGNYLTADGLRALATLPCRVVSTTTDLGRARWECNELAQRTDGGEAGERYAAIFE
ncbi:MAG: TIGR02996 domain-containing protein [Proteobacteria bacterium]|nr:TIGR02996 domain-containing protein [Pseudomonadota bacterium]